MSRNFERIFFKIILEFLIYLHLKFYIMKKLFLFLTLIAFTATFCLTSCGSKEKKDEKTDEKTEVKEDEKEEVKTDVKTESKYKIELQRTNYAPGEKIVATFTADPTWGTSAWIGVIPSDTKHGTEADNDAADVAYKYLDGKASGSVEFNAPTQKGRYDLRMMNGDDATKSIEVFSVGFEVK
jgi:hypothetical protein